MQKLWKVKDILEWTARYFSRKKIEQSRLEADLLLAYVLKQDRVYLYANYDRPVNEAEKTRYRELIKRRAGGEPLAYITGRREFMSLSFKVGPQVLIPRPETELLVETAIRIAQQESISAVWDVGTGSGAIAVSLAHYLPGLKVYATDVSPAALEIAQKNADLNGVKVEFGQGDLLQALPADACLDMVVANLPYVTRRQWEELDESVRAYEPSLALLAGGDGLDLYRRLLQTLPSGIKDGAYLLLEIDPRQSKAAVEMMRGFAGVKILQDWAGRDRLVLARKRGKS